MISLPTLCHATNAAILDPHKANQPISALYFFNRPLQQTITWYMVAVKLLIIPALGHQNKGKSSFTDSDLFVLMSQSGNNNELARHHVPCDRLLQKAYPQQVDHTK